MSDEKDISTGENPEKQPPGGIPLAAGQASPSDKPVTEVDEQQAELFATMSTCFYS